MRPALRALALIVCGAAAGQTVEDLEKQVAAYRRLLNDWAGLTRYGSENAELRPPAPGEQRVVFVGDEITENWPPRLFFPGRPYLNRGIARQITPQMLVRFRQDVISLKPKVVVICAGANDVASIMGPGTQGMIAENIMSMVDLASANGIRVVLASLLPVSDVYVSQTTRRPVGKLIGLNNWLKEYAAQRRAVFLDYYSALVENRAFRKDLTSDGFLPNDAGYAVMRPLAEQAIMQALERR
ncbi:MAG: GDSL-type esterase/lipase family protein [Bryobacteraceae bacterium]